MRLVRYGSGPLVFVCASGLALALACSSSSSSVDATADAGRSPVGPSVADDGKADATSPSPPVDASVPPAPVVDASVADAHDADASSADAGVVGTGGKGGLACARTDDLGGGRTSCVTKVGSVELKIVSGTVPGANAGGPFRLGLYVHGDGATSHIDNSVLQAMLPWADAVHGLAVSALAPNGCAWWLGPSYDCSGSETPVDLANENAAALVSALDAVERAYDVRTDGVRYYSASGGSIFLTSEWIPLHGASHAGVFALMCGGVVSGVPFAWDTSDAALRARSPTWFTYGSEDGLRPQIEQTTADYLGKGFRVTTRMIPNQGHCTFDVHGEAMGIWSANP
jgi:hypothetical protein